MEHMQEQRRSKRAVERDPFFVPWFLASKKDTKFRNKVRTCDEVATPHFDGVRTTPHSQVSIAPMSR